MLLQIFYQTGGQSHLMWGTKNQGKNEASLKYESGRENNLQMLSL